jgi:D-xylose transport system permease protein
MTEQQQINTNGLPLDRADSRMSHNHSVGDYLKDFIQKIKAGDLGSLPVVVGLIIICTVFSIVNPVFLSPNNLVNLLFDSATVGLIALGVVCVLLLGEIDLSIGSMSGVGSAILGVMWVEAGYPLPLVILLAVLLGGVVGLIYALLRTELGMPSFVSTLAGLLALLGFQLYLLGATGSINLPYGSKLVNFGQIMLMDSAVSHSLALLPGIYIIIMGVRVHKKRLAANLSSAGLQVVFIRAILFTIFLQGCAYYLNFSRGVPWIFGLFVLFVTIMDYALTRTKWGRAMFAVGGNAEAARRAGINIKAVYISAFVLCSTLATMGGMLAASRLASASQQAGTADVNLNAIAAAVIGGTSLFGGRGSAWAALLGVIVIMSISNGLTLLNLSSAHRYMITGAVLAIAVVIDSLARKSRVSHGKA